MGRIPYLFLLLFLIPFSGKGQSLELPEAFEHLLQETRLSFYYPLEGNYKAFLPKSQPYQKYDFAMRSRKEELELRFRIYPYDERKPTTTIPHVLAMRGANAPALNQEEYLISVLELDEEYLSERFNADWGTLHYFRPKPGFSDSIHCQMLTIYKEEVGTAIVYFLFDDPGNPYLEQREQCLRFFDPTDPSP
jgi:hypothetical protein